MSVSRDPKKLHTSLEVRWHWMRAAWLRRYPNAPTPFLTCTWRSNAEQSRLFDEGKSKARPGESLHNYNPAYAFDVAFATEMSNGKATALTWDFQWFELWGELAEEIGLEWGGRWKHLVDGPHVQMPMTWRDAKDGKLPSLPPLPKPNSEAITQVVIEGNLSINRDGDTLIIKVTG